MEYEQSQEFKECQHLEIHEGSHAYKKINHDLFERTIYRVCADCGKNLDNVDLLTYEETMSDIPF